MSTPFLSARLIPVIAAAVPLVFLALAPLHADSSRKAGLRRFHRRLGALDYVSPPPEPAAAKRPIVPTAEQIYDRSLNSDATYTYRGRQVTTYWRSGSTIAVMVAHRAPDLRRIDYLAPDIDRGRSIVTDGVQEWEYEPNTRELLHRRFAPGNNALTDAGVSYDLLKQNYLIQVEPQKRIVADRPCWVLDVTRRSTHVLARKLWLDAFTGLVLKRETYRDDGRLSITSSYTDITFRPDLTRPAFDLSSLARRPGVRLVEEKADQETAVPLSTVNAQLQGAARVPQSLAGYQLVSAAIAQVGHGKPVLHLRYSDGLNLLSLFEQQRSQMVRPTLVPRAMRLVQVGKRPAHYARHSTLGTVNWDAGRLNITLVGEIAEPSLLQVAAAADRAIE